MNSRLLQLGAEVLGWRWEKVEGHILVSDARREVICNSRVVKWWGMLPAYMAEALAKHFVHTNRASFSHMGYICALAQLDPLATAPRALVRIAAVLIALERITLEEAREMVG